MPVWSRKVRQRRPYLCSTELQGPPIREQIAALIFDPIPDWAEPGHKPPALDCRNVHQTDPRLGPEAQPGVRLVHISAIQGRRLVTWLSPVWNRIENQGGDLFADGGSL